MGLGRNKWHFLSFIGTQLSANHVPSGPHTTPLAPSADYRALNAVTKPDAYPIPNIVDTLDSLGQSKIFSVLDMASGYDQIAIKPEHREKIAFSCQRSFSVY